MTGTETHGTQGDNDDMLTWRDRESERVRERERGMRRMRRGLERRSGNTEDLTRILREIKGAGGCRTLTKALKEASNEIVEC